MPRKTPRDELDLAVRLAAAYGQTATAKLLGISISACCSRVDSAFREGVGTPAQRAAIAERKYARSLVVLECDVAGRPLGGAELARLRQLGAELAKGTSPNGDITYALTLPADNAKAALDLIYGEGRHDGAACHARAA